MMSEVREWRMQEWLDERERELMMPVKLSGHPPTEYHIEKKAIIDAIRRAIEGPGVDKTSWWYKNCKAQRRKGAKICNSCPFRQQIESQEIGVKVKEGK